MKTSTQLLTIFCCAFATTMKAEIDIRVYSQNIGDTYRVLVDNYEYCPVSVQINFELNNMKSNVNNNSIVVVGARVFEFEIAELHPSITSGKFSYSYNFDYTYGDVNLTYYDSDFVYDLPYQTKMKHRVTQGYYGKKTHRGIHALDFNLSLKTPIHAARGGTIVDVVDYNDKHCFEPSCNTFNNYILIFHNDGTFAQYAHIAKNGAKVNVGDIVKKGQFICFSGNTGYSSGPHLHFSVHLPRIRENEYVPTYFQTQKNAYTILKEGKTYKKPN